MTRPERTAAGPCVFGADIGGTKIHAVLTDAAGSVLDETREPTPTGGLDAVIALVADRFRRLGAGRAVAAAGIGVPGAVDPRTGRISRAANLPGIEGQDFAALMAARLGVPVAVENDVNMAALGESWLGHGRGLPAQAGGLAFVSLGTGIGMGLALGDTLLRGARGIAGEIAFLPIGADPRDPAVQGCGALESVVAGAALVADYRRRGGRRPGSLRDLTRGDWSDPVLDATLDALAGRIALAVLSIESVVDPALFVFGGGIGSRPDILRRVTAALARLGGGPRDCRITLLGNRAGALGAARAAWLRQAAPAT